MTDRPSRRSAMLRPFYFAAGVVLVGVGVAGYVLPFLPGTIWLILAAACFTRSSPKFEAWLVNHPKFGPSVLAWRRYGAIPRRAKAVAIVMMALSFAILLATHPPGIVVLATALILAACALFVLTRPIGPSAG